MTITLEIGSEMEARLVHQAALRGLDVIEYAASLLQNASAADLAPQLPQISMVELFAPLRGLNLDFERDCDLGRDISLRRNISSIQTNRRNLRENVQIPP